MNQKVKVSPHVCGMLKEYHVLTQRIGKFNYYLNNCPSTKELHEQELQLAAMRLYAYHLAKRIELNGTDPEKTDVNELFRHDGYISSDAAILQRFFRQNSNDVLTVLTDLKELCGYAQFYLNTAVGKVIFDTNTDEKQGEQKPIDKVVPKFKVGDKIYLKPEYRMPDDDTPIANTVKEIRRIDDKHYRFDGSYIFIEDQDKYELVEQKPWSEEVQEEQVSEEFINALGTMLNDGRTGMYLVPEERIKMSAEFLFSIARKQLKNEMQEWSEEDEKMLDYICISINEESIAEALRCRGDSYRIEDLTTIHSKQIKWLKSLRPQNRWKSSEEQEAPAIKSCPGIKFRVGDLVVCHDEKDRYFGTKHRISAVYPEHGVYVCEDFQVILIQDQESYGLWEPGPSADDNNINNN